MTLFPTPHIKQLINSLTCPFCQCGMDGMPRKNGKWDSLLETIELVCVQNSRHYSLRYSWNLNDEPICACLEQEQLSLETESYRYVIRQDIGIPRTSIICQEIDGDGRIIESNQLSELPCKAFDFQRASEVEIIRRLKTIFIFQ